MKTSKIILGLFILNAIIFFIPSIAFSQTENLGILQYTPPKDWKKNESENVVVYSNVSKKTGGYCFISLYGATTGTGNPKKDFEREWKNRVVTPFSGEANPKTETEATDEWTEIAGGSAIEFQGSKSLALLTVYSRGDITFSVLGITNDETYLPKLVAFVSGIKEDKTVTVTTNNTPALSEQSTPTTTATATMHAGELVKAFEVNEVRANQNYLGKRVRIYGVVNSIDIEKDGLITLTFRSTVSTYSAARCYFNQSQSSRLAAINANQEVTVEGTVKGLGGGFYNTKFFLVLENCTIP
jgi:tRNA_anti-like